MWLSRQEIVNTESESVDLPFLTYTRIDVALPSRSIWPSYSCIGCVEVGLERESMSAAFPWGSSASIFTLMFRLCCHAITTGDLHAFFTK